MSRTIRTSHQFDDLDKYLKYFAGAYSNIGVHYSSRQHPPPLPKALYYSNVKCLRKAESI